VSQPTPAVTLPCPACREAITLGRADLFPSRRQSFACPRCGAVSRLPWAAVCFGLAMLLIHMSYAALIAKGAGIWAADTFPGLALEAAVFMAICLSGVWVGSLGCRLTARRLTLDVRASRRGARQGATGSS
jgi:hypothetical protein